MLTKEDLESIKSIVKTETDPIRKDTKRIDVKFENLINFIDRGLMNLKKDVQKIQEHLHLPISEI